MPLKIDTHQVCPRCAHVDCPWYVRLCQRQLPSWWDSEPAKDCPERGHWLLRLRHFKPLNHNLPFHPNKLRAVFVNVLPLPRRHIQQQMRKVVNFSVALQHVSELLVIYEPYRPPTIRSDVLFISAVSARFEDTIPGVKNSHVSR